MTSASAGPEVAAAFLRTILEHHGRYRERWVRKAEKPREGEISQAAVARVIADYLLVNAGSAGEYRRLRSLVHRALHGRNLTPQTLTWFVNAFLLTEEHTRQLWALFAGISPDEVDPHVLILAPVSDTSAVFHPPQVKITSLNEVHVVGQDGVPIEHRIQQRIRAVSDDVSRYTVRYDTRSISVWVINGEVSDIYRCGNGMYAFDIMLAQPLKKTETALVEYVVRFDRQEMAPPEFRRIAVERIDDLTMEVRFHPNRLPRAVWWASWHDPAPGSPPATQEPVPLDEEAGCAARKVLSCAERSVIGFCWEW